MRSAVLAACLAAFALAGEADAQNSLATFNPPLRNWTRGTAPSGAGPEAVSYKYDDGTAENAFGITCNAATCNPPQITVVWAQYFDTNDPAFAGLPSDTITRVDVAFGVPPTGATPVAPPPGTAYDVYIFDDSNDDGSPLSLTGADLVTFKTGNASVAPDTNTLESVAVPPGVVHGGFFVIVTMVATMATNPPTPGLARYPAAFDTLPVLSPPTRVWLSCIYGPWMPGNPQASNCQGIWIAITTQGAYMLRAEGTGSGPTSFCTAKSGLVCGLAQISSSGAPSASASSGFVVSAAPARNNKSGILVYNTAQVPALPFQGGTLCVDAMGLRRAGSTNSGAGCAANNCSGMMSIDMNAFSQGNTGLCAPNPCWVVPDCNGAPSGIAPNNAAAFLIVPGTVVFAQYWGRDSVATGSLVSNGLTWTIGP